MLRQITWAQYATAISLLTAVYYVIIGFKFYATEVKLFLLPKGKSEPARAGSQGEDEWKDEDAQEHPGALAYEAVSSTEERDEAELLLAQAEELTPMLKECISTAAEKKYNQQEFIWSLQQLLRQYPTLNIPGYRAAINNLVISECEKRGNLRLSADELETVWLE